MKPLPTYPGMLTDIVLEYGGKIYMQELKVEGVSNSMPFMITQTQISWAFIFCQSHSYWCSVP